MTNTNMTWTSNNSLTTTFHPLYQQQMMQQQAEYAYRQMALSGIGAMQLGKPVEVPVVKEKVKVDSEEIAWLKRRVKEVEWHA